jgi:hypothetical protein
MDMSRAAHRHGDLRGAHARRPACRPREHGSIKRLRRAALHACPGPPPPDLPRRRWVGLRAGLGEGWLVMFDLRKERSWAEKLFVREVAHEGKTIRLLGC